MGVADRDYMRETRPQARFGSGTVVLAFVAILLVVALVDGNAREWLRAHIPSSGPDRTYSYSPLPFGPTIWVGPTTPLYPPHDRWKSYLASEQQCPGGEDRSAPIAAQERAELCLLNFARERAGLPPLRMSPILSAGSRLKALDIIRCQQFAHAACGKDPSANAHDAGYPMSAGWGENIYSGPLGFGAPRVAVDQWLNSPHHRMNLFNPHWTEQGIAVVVAPHLLGQPTAAVWVSEFGQR